MGSLGKCSGERDYGRPLFIVASADLAESPSLSGFGAASGDFPGYGWYERNSNPDGVILPQEITEFANAGIMSGLATVDCPQTGRRIRWFLGGLLHLRLILLFEIWLVPAFKSTGARLPVESRQGDFGGRALGPETADDSRTHFGIFSPGVVAQLFPKGQIINLHPWEHNEVPVLLGAALKLDVPVIALHLTRPPIEIPDRAAPIRDRDRPADQRNARARGGRRGGDRVALLAADAVGDIAHRVDRLMRRAAGDDRLPAQQRLRRLQQSAIASRIAIGSDMRPAPTSSQAMAPSLGPTTSMPRELSGARFAWVALCMPTSARSSRARPAPACRSPEARWTPGRWPTRRHRARRSAVAGATTTKSALAGKLDVSHLALVSQRKQIPNRPWFRSACSDSAVTNSSPPRSARSSRRNRAHAQAADQVLHLERGDAARDDQQNPLAGHRAHNRHPL